MTNSGRVCAYCEAPTCECNCNYMNMKQRLAEKDRGGLFDFFPKEKVRKCAHWDLILSSNKSCIQRWVKLNIQNFLCLKRQVRKSISQEKQ